ncbi:hypothetical protein [Kordiimonas pumila]|uniref:Uncharacterized protein n=1 Tax=Kordiimonas pumila TaxID=2161677 RepID=A0ABV7D3C5_9PROT|nr:hypothetical protein [Kordiimonas pumila]
MDASPITLYDSALKVLLAGTMPALESARLAALLLRPSHTPSTASHAEFADILADEITGGTYARSAVTGLSVSLVDGAVRFTTDSIIFGNPVTVGPVRYLVLVFGSPKALVADSLLFGIADLAPVGGALEAQNSGFTITPPASGWFTLTQGT